MASQGTCCALAVDNDPNTATDTNLPNGARESSNERATLEECACESIDAGLVEPGASGAANISATSEAHLVASGKADPAIEDESDSISLSDEDDDSDGGPPGPDDEYELDGFVVADDTDEDANPETAAGADRDACAIDEGNIITGRRTRRPTRFIYDEPDFADHIATTMLADVPDDEILAACCETDQPDSQVSVPGEEAEGSPPRESDIYLGSSDDDYTPDENETDNDDDTDDDIEPSSDDDEDDGDGVNADGGPHKRPKLSS